MTLRRRTKPPTALPSPHDKARAVEEMFDSISVRYDLLNRLLTLRLDTRWRRRAVAALRLQPEHQNRGHLKRERSRPGHLKPSKLVLDVACGTGDLCNELASAGLRPVGVDFSAGMLAAATTHAPLMRCDALRLGLRDASLDGATCGFALRNFTDLPQFMEELARVLRPGAPVALLEVAEPTNPLLRAGHKAYFGKVVPAIGSLMSNRSAYRYLPESVAYLPEAPVLTAQMVDAGFRDVDRALLSGGIAQLITARREG